MVTYKTQQKRLTAKKVSGISTIMDHVAALSFMLICYGKDGIDTYHAKLMDPAISLICLNLTIA